MKHPAAHLVVCLAAATALLGAVASQATGLADKPLKASVLAKPNVIFGLDDSGSMDSEVLLPNNDGALWWNYTAGNGWSAAGVTHFNAAGDATNQWRKMVYLFPNGTGTGNRVYDDGADAHFAILPTAQFAFTRSPDFNPLYYNPAVTYKAWSPAHVSGALASYPNATPTAAKSHPVYGTGTFNVAADPRAANQSGNFVFTALPGMALPGNVDYRPCDADNANCGAWATTPAAGMAAPGGVTRVSMPYVPATYYLKETCTQNGTDCVYAPDGTTTLKRYEIKLANYGTAAEYNAAIQNFANWFTYYRKRKLMLNASMGQVLEPLTGLNMGVILFNNRPAAGTRVTMYDLDVTNPAINGRRLAGVFYETNGSGGTPTRETLKRIGDEYANAAGPIKYACQRNNAFIVTDGFANVASVNPPAYSQATWGTGAPYATTYADSLANLALGFYTINPRTGMATGKVLKTATDDNTDLHVNTYGLTIGSRGVAFQDETSIPPAPPSDWVAPTQNRHPSAVDDLWHATINGRGSMYLASTPTETAEKIQKAMSDILSQTGAQGGIAVSTVNLSRGDSRAYFGTYNPAGWAGDLTGNPIDKTTGVVSTTAHWSASGQLMARDWTTRQIASWNGTTGVSFTAAAVGGSVNPGSLYGDTGEVMDYLRGDRTHEGTKFRTRTSLIGAIINSEPVISRDHGVAYVQSGEGMLHAFDTRDPNGGSELWAFVPRSVLANIGETVQRGYVFGTQLDGSATLTKLSASSTVLVAGTGVAGRSFHAIDVSSPRGLSQAALAANVKWEFPAFGDATTQAKVGQAIGRPVVVTTKNDGQVALLTSGYNNTLDGKGRLWMVNVNTGAIVHEFTTADGSLATEAGLAQVSAFGEYDGTVRYVYGGDLLGNVWKFDLELKTAPFKLAVLKNASNQTQPVTAAPELLNHKGDRIVYVGTGRILDITDFGNNDIQSFYAIKDGSFLPNARTSLVRQTYTRATDTITNNPVDWTTDRGWYLDLGAGEQANTRPIIAFGAIAFVTNVNGGNDCSASSYLYVLDVASGSKYAGAAFTSKLLSASANSSAVTALRTIGVPGKIVGSGQTTDGTPWNEEIDSGKIIAPAKNSWREIRR